MSTIKVDTVQSSGGGAVTLTKLQALTHWVNYDAVNQTTDGSFNQSSLTDSGTGLFLSSYTSAISGASDKCILGMNWDTENDGSSQRTGNARGGVTVVPDGNSSSLTTAIKFKVLQGSTGSADGGEVDQSGNYCGTLGDLA